jgi:MarR family transcriptional regulator, organic hydroperoxide resistance regulator
MSPRDDLIESSLQRFGRLTQAMVMARPLSNPPWSQLSITLPQLRALGLLSSSEHGMSGRELATALGVGPSAVTPLVDRLVEHGYVRREEDRLDRRITRLLLTEAGMALLQRMTAGRREQMADLLRHLDAEELAVVDRAFELLGLAAERSRMAEAPPAVVAGAT